MSIRVPVHTSQIPENYCFKGFNSTSWPELVSYEYVELPDSYPMIVSPTTPDAKYRGGYVWLKLQDDGNGNFQPLRHYWWQGGDWLARHPLPPGSVMMYFTTNEKDIATFDEGDAWDWALQGNPTIKDRTGPFWEPITRGTNALNFGTDFTARFPVHPGVNKKLDKTGDRTINSGSLDGTDQTNLAINQMPPHDHGISRTVDSKTYMQVPLIAGDWGSYGGLQIAKDDSGHLRVEAVTIDRGNLSGLPAAQPHENLPPFFGVWFIRRTSRLFYRG